MHLHYISQAQTSEQPNKVPMASSAFRSPDVIGNVPGERWLVEKFALSLWMHGSAEAGGWFYPFHAVPTNTVRSYWFYRMSERSLR
jgi:hypothetical protein